MNRVLKALMTAAALAGMASGCATYDYGYARPYYYGYDDYGPYYSYDYGPYYGYAPGYYVGPPLVAFSFHDRDHRRHDDGHRRHLAAPPSRAFTGRNHTAATTASRAHVAAAPALRAGANRSTARAMRPGVNRTADSGRVAPTSGVRNGRDG